MDGGHYTALCKRGQKWILFNDDHITEIDFEKLAEYLNNAYVLFYERHCDFEKEIEPSIILSQYRRNKGTIVRCMDINLYMK